MKCPNCNAPVPASEERHLVCGFCGHRFVNPESVAVDPSGGLSPVVSKLFEDKDRDGIPDIFQGPGGATALQSHTVVETRVTVNGKTYDRMEDVPPEIRKVLENFSAADVIHSSEVVRKVRSETVLPMEGDGGFSADASARVGAPLSYPLSSDAIESKKGRFPAVLFFLLGLAVAAVLFFLLR